MWRRLTQILGLLVSMLGWGFVACTLAMDYWRVAQIGGQGGSSVIEVAWYWSNLWKDCFVDSSDVVNCVDFGVLWKVKPYIQGVRGLLMSGLALGMVGTVFTCVGMECTYIGGGQKNNNKMLFTAAAFHFLGGVSNIAGYCLYINRVAAEFLHAKADPSKIRYDVGAPLCLGLVGGFLCILGSILYATTACRVTHLKSVEPPLSSRSPMVILIRARTPSSGLMTTTKSQSIHSQQLWESKKSSKPRPSNITYDDIVVIV